MKIIQKTPEKIIFVEEAKESLANAIRRSALEIPILAVDEVEFSKNDSVLYDEVIALRMGLLPLKTPKDMNLREECTCKNEGCSKCSVQLKLVAKGPGIIYAKDLNGKAEAVYEDMPIVSLIEEQEIELVATARLGKGIEHTKFSPGIFFYRNVAEIEIGKGCEKCADCAKACPQGILKLEKNKIEVTDKYKCDLCEACVEVCRKDGESEIKISPGKELIFTIESFGQIKADEILARAVDVLIDNLKELK
ncbi:DNA-directed RNA polymerase subunit D [Candidatus Pacearchaeota archaeon]|nr:DNA-directed RNA polymerase subunit D [Candidatus Pacearchaeota archaeon]